MPPSAIATERPPIAAPPVIARAWVAKTLAATMFGVLTGVEKYPDGTAEQIEFKQYELVLHSWATCNFVFKHLADFRVNRHATQPAVDVEQTYPRVTARVRPPLAAAAEIAAA